MGSLRLYFAFQLYMHFQVNLGWAQRTNLILEQLSGTSGIKQQYTIQSPLEGPRSGSFPVSRGTFVLGADGETRLAWIAFNAHLTSTRVQSLHSILLLTKLLKLGLMFTQALGYSRLAIRKQTTVLLDFGHFVFRADVRRSQRMSDPLHHPWLTTTDQGTVLAAQCDCMAGWVVCCSNQ